MPDEFPKDQQVWLHFQAVDWRADVWVNGRKVAEHEGGYSPFSVDITEAVRRDGENALVVRAFDPTDAGLPTGKQVGWYTPTSGIWQTVWLEARPATHVSGVKITTKFANPGWEIRVHAEIRGRNGSEFTVSAQSLKMPKLKFQSELARLPAVTGPSTRTSTMEVGMGLIHDPADLTLWTPDNPHLYDLVLEVATPGGGKDTFATYFGVREVSRGKLPGEDFERILLNGTPIYWRGALDQSFNPKGVYTAPSDDFLKKDIELAKSLGLNFLRIHIKPDEPRRLYWADKLGLLIMEDMPNTWRQDARARAAWEGTMREIIARDRNHPAIFSWVAFNETWGLGSPPDYKKDRNTQDWVKGMVAEVHKLDPTRLVEDNSPCNFDHVEGTDLNSWHFYIDNHEAARRHIDEVVARSVPGSDFNYCPGQKMNTAPLINSEYGSVGAGDGDRDVSWGFRDLTTLLRKQPKIQGYVYTELSDIEWEHNGFADYDRTRKTFGYDGFIPGMTAADLQGPDFIGYDAPPVVVAQPGEVVRIPWFVSHYSDRKEATMRWWLVGHDDKGEVDRIEPQERPVEWAPYGVTPQPKPVGFKIKGPWTGALALELLDKDGARIAANFVNVVIRPEQPADRLERVDDNTVALRFRPDDFASRKWAGYPARDPAGKAQGLGKGFFEYRLKVPDAVIKAKPQSLRFLLEASSRAGREQVDFADRTSPVDNPQTDERTWPSDLEIQLNGESVASVELEDDPADARGVLSHLAGVDHGSFGDLLKFEVRLPQKVREALEAGQPLRIRLVVPEGADHAGGLALFGATTGRYPFDPTIEIVTADPLPAELGVPAGESVAIESAASRRVFALDSADTGREPSVWSYSTTDPGPKWADAGFDDSAWKTGKAGFGTAGTPGIRVNTPWSTRAIWLRKSVDLPELGADDVLTLRLYHDEDVEVFVNGKRLFTEGGYVTAYRDVVLNASQKSLFRPGKNQVAVVCRQTTGGQGVDVGLVLLRGGE